MNRYFRLNDFLDKASPSPAVDDGWSAAGISGSASTSSSIVFGGEDGGDEGGGSVDTTISEAGDAMVAKGVALHD